MCHVIANSHPSKAIIAVVHKEYGVAYAHYVLRRPKYIASTDLLAQKAKSTSILAEKENPMDTSGRTSNALSPPT